MTLHIVDSVDYTVTTDANGYFDYTFAGAFDQAFATGSSPQSGNPGGVVSVTIQKTGTTTVTCRVWVATGTPDVGSVVHAANEQVTVSLLAVAG